MIRSDEFTIEIEDDWVHLLDGEQTVRVSMPQDIWDELVSSYFVKQTLDSFGFNP